MLQHVTPMTWMHGTGNRFALIDGPDLAGVDPSELANKLAGGPMEADGLLVLELEDGQADLCMNIFNADGSTATMCGNGLRCVAYHAYLRNLVRGRSIRIRIGGSILAARVVEDDGEEAMVCAQMPVPQVEDGPDLIQVQLGNSHGVLLNDRLPNLAHWEDQVRMLHDKGLDDMNLHVACIIDRSTIQMRSWERGSGPTLACASGATAVACALASRGLTEQLVNVNQPGGQLRVHWRGPSRRPMNMGSAACLPTPVTRNQSMAGVS